MAVDSGPDIHNWRWRGLFKYSSATNTRVRCLVFMDAGIHSHKRDDAKKFSNSATHGSITLCRSESLFVGPSSVAEPRQQPEQPNRARVIPTCAVMADFSSDYTSWRLELVIQGFFLAVKILQEYSIVAWKGCSNVHVGATGQRRVAHSTAGRSRQC